MNYAMPAKHFQQVICVGLQPLHYFMSKADSALQYNIIVKKHMHINS